MDTSNQISDLEHLRIRQMRIRVKAAATRDSATSLERRRLRDLRRRVSALAVQATDPEQKSSLTKKAELLERHLVSGLVVSPESQTATRWLLLAYAWLRGKTWNQTESKHRPINDGAAINLIVGHLLDRLSSAEEEKSRRIAIQAWLKEPDKNRFDLGIVIERPWAWLDANPKARTV